MYLPSFFREDRLDVLHEFIEGQQPMPWSVDDALQSRHATDLDELIRPPR